MDNNQELNDINTVENQSLNIEGTNESDILFGASGDDTISGLNSSDFIEGEGGKDLLYGGNGEDTLFGNQGNDLLNGGEDQDILRGGLGNDIILGGEGSDTLIGGENTDLLLGGEGSDIFVLESVEGYDFIADFEDGTDFLALGSSLDFADLSLVDVRGGVTILDTSNDNSKIAFLSHVCAVDITADDFATFSDISLSPVYF